MIVHALSVLQIVAAVLVAAEFARLNRKIDRYRREAAIQRHPSTQVREYLVATTRKAS